MTSNLVFSGRLGADPQVQVGTSGLTRAQFRVAVDHGPKENRKTTWVPVTAFDSLGENVGASLTKGMMVNVVGRFDSYEKAVVIDGNEVNLTMLTVVAYSVSPDLKYATVAVTKNEFRGDNGGGQQAAPAQAAAPAAAPAAAAPAAAAPVAAPVAAGGDDF
jgi:single-stranded DNA-binding protein